MDFDIEKILKISLTAMRVVRCHPEIPRDCKWVIQILLGFTIFMIPGVAIFYSIFWINLRQNDFSEACRNGIFLITGLGATMKYFIMIRFRNIILNLFENMETDLESAKSLPIDEQSIIRDSAAKERAVCKQWLFLTLCCCGSFHVKMILLNTYNYIIGVEKLVNLYDIAYPEAIEDIKNTNMCLFLFMYFSMFYYGAYSAVMYIAFVPLGPIFMLHAAAQLTLVRKSVDRLYQNEVDGKDINDKLRGIIRHLQRIYDFVGRVSSCMTIFYEFTLKFTSIVLPVTLFELIKSLKSGNPSFEFTTFLFISVISSSLPCYYGDLLLEKGEEVRQSIYGCGWERRYERNTRRTMLLLHQRGSQPIMIRTMFRNICLDALTDVFQQAYAIFNLINTVWE